MAATLSFDRLRSIVVATVTHLPDYRTRPNTVYEIADAALGAFAVFFMQSPSFLAHQRDMQRVRGQNNARSLFGGRFASAHVPIATRAAKPAATFGIPAARPEHWTNARAYAIIRLLFHGN